MERDVDSVVGHVRCSSRSSVTLLRCQGHVGRWLATCAARSPDNFELDALEDGPSAWILFSAGHDGNGRGVPVVVGSVTVMYTQGVYVLGDLINAFNIRFMHSSRPLWLANYWLVCSREWNDSNPTLADYWYPTKNLLGLPVALYQYNI